MKPFLKLLFIGLINLSLITSCSKDDNKDINYASAMVNTTWNNEGVITHEGNNYDALLQLSFQTSSMGNLKTQTTGNSSAIELNYAFTYTMSSNSKGVINFEDTSLGTVTFNVNNNELILNSRTYTKQE